MAVDYTEDVVEPLGYGFEAGEGQGSYGPDSLDWDCTIGGLNFLYATSDQDPIIRETGKFRRERIDTERNPGEQSSILVCGSGRKLHGITVQACRLLNR